MGLFGGRLGQFAAISPFCCNFVRPRQSAFRHHPGFAFVSIYESSLELCSAAFVLLQF